MYLTPQIFLCLVPMAASNLTLSTSADAVSPDERFGVMTHFAQGWDPALIPKIAQARIPTVRDELYWDTVETQPGAFSFPREYNRYMAGLWQNQVTPLIVLSFENKNYDGGLTPHTPEAFDAYARYAVAVLRAYGSQVKAVEIWNEYNGTFCHGPATEDRAGTYVGMLRAAYTAIKRERPDVTVVAGATSGVPLPYWEKLFKGGALEFMDALSVHPYRYDQPPEGVESDIAALQDLMREYDGGKPRPVWVTEIGWFVHASEAPGDLEITERTQAQFLVRAYALLLSAGVPRIYWYLYQDTPDFTMGLVRADADHAAKPVGRALTALIAQLRDAHFVRREDTPADVYSIQFERPSGEAVRVIWSLQPRLLPLTGATQVNDLEGNAISMQGPLLLDDSPVFVTGPLAGLPFSPPSDPAPLADSVHDFSIGNDTGEWSYGEFVGSNPDFVSLTAHLVSDWQRGWTSDDPFLRLTAVDQHPSHRDATAVAAVRRWSSRYDGPVRITGYFRCGLLGDGVGVSILIDGRPRFREALGGGQGRTIVESFDFTVPVKPGTTVDFVVDPGPSTQIENDATAVAVVIRKASP